MAGKFVDDYLLFQLAVISQSLSEEFYAYLKQRGVTPARWRVLVNLVDGDMYVNDLARNTMFEQSRVTKLIDQLTSEGLVERRADSKDRRRVKACITPKGKSLTLPLMDAAKKHEEQVLSELPDAERERFQKTLAHFVRAHFHNGSTYAPLKYVG